MSANFTDYERDEFRPNYGEVNWTPRLNALLEQAGVELEPIAYEEDGKEPMQVTQENTIVYINQIADELDCIAVKYDQDKDDLWTFYFPDRFPSREDFNKAASWIGNWALVMTSLYPLQEIVEHYERFQAQDLDRIPEDWM